MKNSQLENENRLLTVKNLADILKISERTIYNKVSDGSFPVKPIRIGRRLLRWRSSDIDRYLKSL